MLLKVIETGRSHCTRSCTQCFVDDGDCGDVVAVVNGDRTAAAVAVGAAVAFAVVAAAVAVAVVVG